MQTRMLYSIVVMVVTLLLMFHATLHPVNAQTTAKDDQMPEKGEKVEYQGRWLTTNMRQSSEGSLTIVIFRGDGFYFGFGSKEQPDEYGNISWKKFKGVKGTFTETKTIQISVGWPPVNYKVRMLKSIVPILDE